MTNLLFLILNWLRMFKLNARYQTSVTRAVITTKQYSPNAIQNEKELNENTAKGQDATHYDTRQWFCEKGLFRNLARNLVCTNWVFNRL